MYANEFLVGDAEVKSKQRKNNKAKWKMNILFDDGNDLFKQCEWWKLQPENWKWSNEQSTRRGIVWKWKMKITKFHL